MQGSRAEVEERALPFRPGDEVLVQIVEPHMYNVDDAVAKIDGYIVSITNGGRFVGTKRLVRIEEIGRTSAVASLIGEESELPPPSSDGGDDVQSKPRRRGRRGGRRRSAAKAETAGAETAGE
jgi:ribonuclease G